MSDVSNLTKKLRQHPLTQSLRTLEGWTLLITLFLLAATNISIFVDSDLAGGWDGLFAYDLFLKTVAGIKNFDFFPIDLSQYAGQPLFYQYPPLLYWFLSILYLILFQWLTPTIFWNGLIYVTPFLFYFTFLSLIKSQVNSKKYILITSIATLPLLYVSEFGSHLGLGFSGLINAGLFTAAVSIIIFIHILKLALQIQTIQGPHRLHAHLTFWTVIMGLSHAAGLIAVGFIYLYLYATTDRRSSRWILLSGFTALLTLAPWLYFFVVNSYYIYSTPGKTDHTGIYAVLWMFHYTMQPWRGMPKEKVFIYLFQCLGTLIAFVSVFYSVFIKKEKIGLLWLLAAIIFMVGIPNGDFLSLSNANYHFYRLVAYGMIITSFLVAHFLNQIQEKHPKVIWSYFSVMVAFLMIGAVPFSKSNQELFSHFDGKLTHTPYYLDSIKPLIEDIRTGNLPHTIHRIVSDGDLNLRSHAAGPHSINYALSQLPQLEVMQGLYAEGSPVHQYIVNSIYSLNPWTLFWGAKKLYLNYDQSLNAGDELRFLAYLGIDHLVLNNPKSVDNLLQRHSDQISLVKSYGKLNLLRVNNPRPLISGLSQLPPAFIHVGPGHAKNNFFAYWSTNYQSKDQPVLFIKVDSLESVQWTDFSTAIMHLKDEYKDLMPHICEISRRYSKNFIIVGVDTLPCKELSHRFHLLTSLDNFTRTETQEAFKNLIVFPQETAVTFTKFDENKQPDSHLSFQASGPTLIRYAYYPMWKIRDKKSHIYEVYPNFMYVNYHGPLELVFDY